MNIHNLKETTRIAYKSKPTIRCHKLKKVVTFNVYGWIHLSHTRDGHSRSPQDTKLRYYLFQYAYEVIKNSKIAIESSGTVTSKNKVVRPVKYYELVHICKSEKRPISVILRKIQDGKLHFWSIRRTNNKIKKALKMRA